ncbi:hypothetical protein [Methylorubrum suomiense]|uniref:Uncharacterized protein n=1 Tax=Methylorubrum suomiense TaxID=144191 RepID=A0ABQ4UWM2_9HYPH|nr:MULTISPECIES: hypothetical protein [Methylobacteriaceae]GJE75437.1 hypothetical protein BGCPKDLD_2021 [Methylorubrum suomiense]
MAPRRSIVPLPGACRLECTASCRWTAASESGPHPAETRSILIGLVAMMLPAACLGLALACLVLLEERPLQDAAGVKRDG